MAKIPYAKMPRAVRPSHALLALLGTAAVQYLAITADFEGYVPLGYLDPVGIPTKCFGDTTNVQVGKKYSFEECEKSLNTHSVEIIKPIRKCIKNFNALPDKSKAAIASMAYNIGPSAMCSSSIIKYANAGNLTRMCSRMREIYLYATDRKTGKKVVLDGLKIRRNKEADLCEQGLKESKEVGNAKDKTIDEILLESAADSPRISPRADKPVEPDKIEVVHQAPSDSGFFSRLWFSIRSRVQSVFN